MKQILEEFCCLAPLRSGCFIIAIFKIVTSTMYLFGYCSHLDHVAPNTTVDKRVEEFVFHEGATVSFIACSFNYVISVILIIAVYRYLICVIMISAFLLFLEAVFFLICAIYAACFDHIPSCIVISMYFLLQLYFTLVVFSYHLELVEEQEFWSQLTQEVRTDLDQERVQAKEQGLPDPMKAALRKYRASVTEEKPPRPKPVQHVTESMASQAGPS